ncbi:tetratricopeptide repeat protein [Flavobacterium sp.]|uniref:tetratricopeptide repeat protein n=1 Tax=Flavobacterium sp. TaxID=239 RepID=UPI003F6A4FDF
MKKIIILFLLVYIKSFACLNGDTKVLTNGVFIYEDREGIIPYGHFFYAENFEKLKKELDSLYTKTNNLDYLSDIGYVLTVERKYNEAIHLFLEIEKKQPNRYSTASNIGTLYELIGNNEEALKWITKAVKINPDSHNNSEWLHVNILEAKTKGATFYNGLFLIDVNFGIYDKPISTLSSNKENSLINALFYQLNERITFIKDKDVIIANLLFELGNLCMIQERYKDALEIFKMSKEYGFTNQIIDIRISFINGYLEAKSNGSNNHVKTVYSKEKYNIEKTILLLLSICIGLGVILYLFKRKKAV